ncbi:hypothetical protein C8J56DRAFT_900949 [Mycena floridula]|nr:hypothetical protein C8J56DRAFT_900949 [Mycena floridula]
MMDIPTHPFLIPRDQKFFHGLNVDTTALVPATLRFPALVTKQLVHRCTVSVIQHIFRDTFLRVAMSSGMHQSLPNLKLSFSQMLVFFLLKLDDPESPSLDEQYWANRRTHGHPQESVSEDVLDYGHGAPVHQLFGDKRWELEGGRDKSGCVHIEAMEEFLIPGDEERTGWNIHHDELVKAQHNEPFRPKPGNNHQAHMALIKLVFPKSGLNGRAQYNEPFRAKPRNNHQAHMVLIKLVLPKSGLNGRAQHNEPFRPKPRNNHQAHMALIKLVLPKSGIDEPSNPGPSTQIRAERWSTWNCLRFAYLNMGANSDTSFAGTLGGDHKEELPENDHYDAQASFAPALGPQPLPETEIAAIPDQRIAYRPGKVVPVDVSTGIDLVKRYGADQTRPASNQQITPSVIVMEGAVTIGKLMQALMNALSGKVHLLKRQTDFVGFEIRQDGKWEAKFQRPVA